MKRRPRILHLEDDPVDAELVAAALDEQGLDVDLTHVSTGPEFREALAGGSFDLVLSDFGVPGFGGGQALADVRAVSPDLPFVFVSGTIGEERAVEMLRQGATDYIVKGRHARLRVAVERALKDAREQSERREAQRALEESRRLLDRASRASPDLIYVADLAARRLVFLNRTAGSAASFGHDPAALAAMTSEAMSSLAHPADEPLVRAHRKRLFALPEGEVAEVVIRIHAADGRWRWACFREVVFERAPDGRALSLVGHAQDVTEPRQAELRLRLEHAVTRVLAESADADEAVTSILEALVLGTGLAVGELWVPDPGGSVLQLAACWYHGSAGPLEVVAATRHRTTLAGGEGVVGRVWAKGAAEWVTDLERGGAVDAPLASEGGFTAALVAPVRQEGQVAVLALFGSPSLPDDTALLDTVERLATRVGDFLGRKRAEKELVRRDRELAEAQRLAKLGSWSWDVQEDRLYWSEETRRLFGMAPGGGPLRSEAYFSRIHPDDVDLVRQSLAPLGGGAREFWNDHRIVRDSGEVLIVHARGRATHDPAGRLVRVVGTMMDITERQRAERRIAEQAALLERASGAIHACTFDDETVTFWNAGCEALHGWTRQDAVGHPCAELMYRDPTPAFVAARAALLRDGDWSGELELLRRDGRRVPVDCQWTLVRDEGGRPRSLLAIENDATERRQAEQRLLRAQRMESIGTLAGGIAHDLNNVLSPIVMAVDILRGRTTDERSARLLATVEASAARGADMVRQILGFARGMDGERVLLQVAQAVREIATLVRETFPKNVTLNLELPGDLPLVRADATQLHQVLLNLCVNARDAMPAGGVLTLAAERVELDAAAAASLGGAAQPGTYVVVSVTDSGAGISPEDAQRIFEPFFTTKQPGQGTGLGLSTSLAIVKGHGGFIDVRTSPGRGATFSVFLPVATRGARSAATGGPSETPVAGAGRTILVVDDESAIREMARATLETNGFEVLVAGDGAEAVAVYAANPGRVDVVVLDMDMPVMDGRSAIRALRRIDPAVLILAVSGRANPLPWDPEEAPAQVLAKPFSTPMLLGVLGRLLAAAAPVEAVPSRS